MSVLSFPRIYFKGYMAWDPCTFNNNDWQEFPTYDAANAALNWSFLNTHGITQDNFNTTFRPWAIQLAPDTIDSPSGPRVPAEWNMFGTHGVSFVEYPPYTTTVIGGDLAYGSPITSGDGLIGGPVNINGDGGSGPGRLVDTNPMSFWSSQVYFDQLSFGSGDCMITGTPSVRMHSRWLDLSRIYSQDQFLTQPAAGVGCCLQAGIPYDQITWPTANCNSNLAAKLKSVASQSPAQGIMVRFTAYVNVYFKNGILNNNTSQAPRDYEELADLLATAWAAWNNNGDTSLFFSQPCYSHVVGVVGVWNVGELASVPGGRYLSAVNAVSPAGATTASPQLYSHSPTHQVRQAEASDVVLPATLLGPLVAEVNYDQKLISLDLNSTMPESGPPGVWPSDLTKTNFGSLDLGVVKGGAFTHIVDIDYKQYNQAPYEAKAGIIDIPFPDSNTDGLLKTGLIAIRVQNQIALQEQNYSAQTDTRGIYLDQGGSTEFNISVFAQGKLSPGTNVMIAKYDQNLSLIPSNQTQFVNFTSGNQQTITVGSITTAVTVVTAGANGIATVGIAAAESPGFPVLAFYPYSGTTLPQPPVSLLGAAGPLITYAFYTTVRVLPFDNQVPQQFCDLWNSNQNSTQAWQFVYNQILYVYDMLFNVMLEHVNLGSQSAVDNSLCSIWNSITAAAAQESTYAMPITRDMSAGKRLALQLYIYLAYNNFNLGGQPLTVNSIPPGWTPCGKKAAFGRTTKT